jgi:hypothetical protein
VEKKSPTEEDTKLEKGGESAVNSMLMSMMSQGLLASTESESQSAEATASATSSSSDASTFAEQKQHVRGEKTAGQNTEAEVGSQDLADQVPAGVSQDLADQIPKRRHDGRSAEESGDINSGGNAVSGAEWQNIKNLLSKPSAFTEVNAVERAEQAIKILRESHERGPLSAQSQLAASAQVRPGDADLLQSVLNESGGTVTNGSSAASAIGVGSPSDSVVLSELGASSGKVDDLVEREKAEILKGRGSSSTNTHNSLARSPARKDINKKGRDAMNKGTSLAETRIHQEKSGIEQKQNSESEQEHKQKVTHSSNHANSKHAHQHKRGKGKTQSAIARVGDHVRLLQGDGADFEGVSVVETYDKIDSKYEGCLMIRE